MQLTLNSHISAGNILLDTDLRKLGTVTLASGTYLYAATGQHGGIAGWRLDPTGAAAQLIDVQYFPASFVGATGAMLECLSINGSMQLIFGSNSGPGLLSYAINAQGQITSASQINGISQASTAISALASFETPSGTVLYVADPGTGRVTAYAQGNSGDFTALSPIGPAADFILGGPVRMQTIEVGGSSFLLATDHTSNGVVSYRIQPGTGALDRVAHIGAGEGLGIATPTALESVSAFGQAWVILGAANSNSISVLRLDSAGNLHPVEHVLDTLVTRFGGLQSLAVVQSGDHVFVLAGGGDDGLSLLALLPDGRLVHLQSLAHTMGAGLMNVGQIDAAILGNQIQVFVTSADTGGVTQYSIALNSLGNVIRDLGAGATQLNGTNRDDMIVAGATGADTLSGAGGNDILVAGAGGNTLSGGAGADRFVLNAEATLTRILDFSPGADILDLSDFPMLRSLGQLTITNMTGGARISFRDAVIEVSSTSGGPLSTSQLLGPMAAAGFEWPDHVMILRPLSGIVFRGTAAHELAEGTVRDDTLMGNQGRDTLIGGAGNDLLLGGDGDDSLTGGDGRDEIWGGAGNDTVIGGAGNDTMGGAAGDDLFYAGAGNDEVWANGGNDTLWGGPDNDTLGGSSGNDSIEGQGGHDQLWGGPGADTLFGGAGNDTLGGREGNDILDGGGGNDEIWTNSGDDLAIGGAGNDTLGGSTGNDTLLGGAGADELIGGSGNDVLDGGAGNDLLLGGDGDDSLSGGDGNDVIWGGAGNDTVIGGAGNDTLGGAAGDDLFYAGTGNDEVWANGGNDTLWGGADDDTLGGSDGDDSLQGEGGHDQLWGGPGTDTLWGGAGNDTLGGREGNDILGGGDGNDEIWANSGDDLAIGGAGNDTLGGSDGSDTLLGGTGADDLRGGSGNDVLDGGAGDDLVDGGTGHDILTGGSGADVFFFVPNQGNDRITDFEIGIDVIQMQAAGLGFGGLSMVQWQADVVIHFDSGRIILSDTTLADLDADDFLFG